MKACEGKNYTCGQAYAKTMLVKNDIKIIPTMKAIMANIDKREANVEQGGRISHAREMAFATNDPTFRDRTREGYLAFMEYQDMIGKEFEDLGWESSIGKDIRATQEPERKQLFDIDIEEAAYRIKRVEYLGRAFEVWMKGKQGPAEVAAMRALMLQYDGLYSEYVGTEPGMAAPGLTGRGYMLKELGYPEDFAAVARACNLGSAKAEAGSSKEEEPSDAVADRVKEGDTLENTEPSSFKSTQQIKPGKPVDKTSEAIDPSSSKGTQPVSTGESFDEEIKDTINDTVTSMGLPDSHLSALLKKLVAEAQEQTKRAHRGFGLQLNIEHGALPQGNSAYSDIALMKKLQADNDAQAEEIRALKVAFRTKERDIEAEARTLQGENLELKKTSENVHNKEIKLPKNEPSTGTSSQGPKEDDTLEAERARALDKLINYDRKTKHLHNALFKIHANIVGEGLHSRDEYDLFSADDVKHFLDNHEETSEAFARTMVALAAGNSALAVALWNDMETWISGYLMQLGMAFAEIEQKHLDREICRFAPHFYHKNCRD